MENKKVRKIKKVILRVLGVLAIFHVSLYLVLANSYLCPAYINKVNYKCFYNLFKSYNPTFAVVMILMLAFVVTYAIGIIQLMDTTSSSKWRKRIQAGYRKIIILSLIAVFYLIIGMYVFPPSNKNKEMVHYEMITAWLLCASYFLTAVFLIYKKISKKDKMFDPVNFILVVALVLSFLSGGILIPKLKPYGSIFTGITQSLPLIFLIYFEFVYMPVLLTRKRFKEKKKK